MKKIYIALMIIFSLMYGDQCMMDSVDTSQNEECLDRNSVVEKPVENDILKKGCKDIVKGKTNSKEAIATIYYIRGGLTYLPIIFKDNKPIEVDVESLCNFSLDNDIDLGFSLFYIVSKIKGLDDKEIEKLFNIKE